MKYGPNHLAKWRFFVGTQGKKRNSSRNLSKKVFFKNVFEKKNVCSSPGKHNFC